jgi:hypothetical protein
MQSLLIEHAKCSLTANWDGFYSLFHTNKAGLLQPSLKPRAYIKTHATFVTSLDERFYPLGIRMVLLQSIDRF